MEKSDPNQILKTLIAAYCSINAAYKLDLHQCWVSHQICPKHAKKLGDNVGKRNKTKIVAAYCSIFTVYKLDLQHTGFFPVKYAPNCITLKTKFQTE